jgi:predicted RNase H-like nuclease (RuvC/YqgF family)
MAKAKIQKSEIQELSEFIRDHMVTKREFSERNSVVDNRFEAILKVLEGHTEILENHTMTLAEIRTEVRELRRDAEDLKEKVRGHAGYTKEVDHILLRIGRIEKHLKMKPIVA